MRSMTVPEELWGWYQCKEQEPHQGFPGRIHVHATGAVLYQDWPVLSSQSALYSPNILSNIQSGWWQRVLDDDLAVGVGL